MNTNFTSDRLPVATPGAVGTGPALVVEGWVGPAAAPGLVGAPATGEGAPAAGGANRAAGVGLTKGTEVLGAKVADVGCGGTGTSVRVAAGPEVVAAGGVGAAGVLQAVETTVSTTIIPSKMT